MSLLRELLAVLRSLPTEVPRMLTEGLERFARRQHEPVVIDGEPYCTNHWRPRVQPWPCAALVEYEARKSR